MCKIKCITSKEDIMEKIQARSIAINILDDIEQNGAYSNISIEKHLRNKNISNVDRGLIRELVYGVLENKLYLDYGIRSYSKLRLKKIDKSILNVLRISFYQLLYLDKVPNFAVVDEAVNLSKKINFRTKGFVNALLRNFIRNDFSIDLEKIRKNKEEYLSIKYSHPLWLVQRWIKEFGEEFTKNLLKANNETPNLSVRVNTLKTTKEELIKVLEENDLMVKECKYANDGLILGHVSRLDKLEPFKKGLFQVQDESSMLVASVLDPKPNEKVLDICAAPGGKSTHMAQLMKNQGEILARDIYEHKLNLIRENVNRLGIKNINTQIWNATEIDLSKIEYYDKVLVDAPCSGFGIIRRKPELRYNKTDEDIVEISNLQFEILKAASKYVKENGVLVYSTCTIEEMENEQLINRFLKENKDFSIEKINNQKMSNLVDERGLVKLYPNVIGTDGFFIAKLRKTSNKCMI